MRVGLPVSQAREPVEAVAANAAAGLRVGLVQIDPNRKVERVMPGALAVVRELLDPRVMRDRRMRERPGAGRFGGVLPGLPVYQIQALGLRVVRLQILVRDRPRRRDAPVVTHLLKVALAKPEQNRPVKLGVPSDEVLLVRLVRRAVL